MRRYGQSLWRSEPQLFLFKLLPQPFFVVLAAMKHSEDRDDVSLHGERDGCLASIVRHPQARSDVIAPRTAVRECDQALAVTNQAFCVAAGSIPDEALAM